MYPNMDTRARQEFTPPVVAYEFDRFTARVSTLANCEARLRYPDFHLLGSLNSGYPYHRGPIHICPQGDEAMMGPFMKRAGTLVVAICLVTLPVLQTAQAAIIPTDTAIEMIKHQDQIGRINELLARDSVQQVLISLGVDPADASARVQSLTAEELQTLEQDLAELPAGSAGVIEVIGIVALVLIILELLDVTNLFTEF